MQHVSVKHGERRSAIFIDAKLYQVVDALAARIDRKDPPISLAVVRPTECVRLGPFTGIVHLDLVAAESTPDAECDRDTPCIVKNEGPDLVMIESLGRHRGVKYTLDAGEEQDFPLSVFDKSEVFEISIVPKLQAAAEQPACVHVPCDRSPEGICPKCDAEGPRV